MLLFTVVNTVRECHETITQTITLSSRFRTSLQNS